MGKKFVQWLCAIVVVTLLVLIPAACTPKPAAPTAPTAPAAEVKPVVLKFADFSPPGTARTDALKWFGDEVEKRTNGQVKFEFYWSEALIKSANMMDSLKSGLVNGVAWLPSYGPTKTPLMNVGSMPFLGKTMLGAHRAFQNLIETEPLMQAELAAWDAKLLWVVPMAATQVYSNKPIKSLADFKGLKIRSLGYAEIPFKVMGAATVTIPMPEMYEALQRGTVDAEFTALHAWYGYGHADVTKYILKDHLGFLPSFLHFISKSTYDKLTPEQQKIIDEVRIDAFYRTNDLMEKEAGGFLAEATKKGVTSTSLPPGEYAQWVKMGGPPTFDKWISDMKAKGLPAEAMLAKWKAALEKEQALIPQTQ